MTTESAFSILNWMTLVLCGGLLAIATIATYLYLFDKVMQLLKLKQLFFKFLVARHRLKQLVKDGESATAERESSRHPHVHKTPADKASGIRDVRLRPLNVDKTVAGPHPVETCGCPICTEYRAKAKTAAERVTGGGPRGPRPYDPDAELSEDESSEGGCNE